MFDASAPIPLVLCPTQGMAFAPDTSAVLEELNGAVESIISIAQQVGECHPLVLDGLSGLYGLYGSG